MKVCSVCDRCYDDSVAFCTEENHPALAETHDGSLEMIPGYRLERLVESGVKNRTYSARQLASDQNCLIRILSATEYVDAHVCEAKQAAVLFHPNVVDTYEAGMLENGESYVVSEDPDGRTMREFLQDVGLPELKTSFEVVRQIAEALHALHLSGLKHGAIRPENIVLTSDRERGLFVRIQNPDFGGAIARSVVSNKFLTESALDQIKYFAPEQCSGEETSPQTDVYSLGIVFYELLAGTPPFDASKAVGLIEMHKSRRVPEIRINNFQSQMLVTHCLTEALQKQPRLRQSSANVFARQLRHIEQLATHASTLPPAGVAPAWRPLPPTAVPASDEPSRSVSPSPKPAVRTDLPIQSNAFETSEPLFSEVESQPGAPRTTDNERAGIPSYSEMIDRVISRDIKVEVPREPIVEPVHESIHAKSGSRLRSWKEKVKWVVEGLVPETSAAPRTSIFDSVDRTILKGQSAGVEVLPSEADDVSSGPAPKKIEWQTPDDDIPSEAAVLQVLAKEGPVEAEGPVIAAPEKALEIPTIEPTGDEVIQAPLEIQHGSEPIEHQVAEQLPEEERKAEIPVWVETPVVIETSPAIDAEPVVSENLAATETPVDAHVPVAAEEPVSRDLSPVPESKPRIDAHRPERLARRRAARARPAKVTPRTAEPVLAESGRNLRSPAVPDVRPAAKTPKPASKRSGLGFPVNLADLEEITIVRAPSKRIRVDWERAAAEPRRSNVMRSQRTTTRPAPVGFSPTILGGTPKRKRIERKRTVEMFSTDQAESESNVTGRYHSVVVGAGIVALIGLFLFGFGSVTRYFETSSAADSTPVAQTAAPDAGALPAADAEPAAKTTSRTLVRPPVETKPAVESKPVVEAKPVVETSSKRNRTALPEKPAARKTDTKAKADASKPSKPNATPTAKAPAKGASQKVAVVKSKAIAPASTVKGSTRPRVVQNAKP